MDATLLESSVKDLGVSISNVPGILPLTLSSSNKLVQRHGLLNISNYRIRSCDTTSRFSQELSLFIIASFLFPFLASCVARTCSTIAIIITLTTCCRGKIGTQRNAQTCRLRKKIMLGLGVDYE